MSGRHWDLNQFRRVRDAHLRKARRAAELARDSNCSHSTRNVWREHCRQHVKAARREHWLLVAQARAISCAMFLRKTCGAHQRAPRKTVGGHRVAA